MTQAVRIASGQALLSLLVRQQRPLLLKGVFLGSLATLLLILQWYGLARLVDDVVGQGLPLSLVGLALLSVVIVLRAWLLRWQDQLCTQASVTVRFQLRQALLAFWHRRSAVENHRQSPAALASQWLEDIESMDGYFARYWPQQYLTLISPVLMLSVVLYVNWLAALLLLIAAPLIPVFMVLVGKGAEALNQRYLSQRQRLAGHFLDRVKHLATIRLFDATAEVSDEIVTKSQHYRIIVMKTLRIAFLSSAVLEFFTSVAVASIAIYIGFALYGAITWGPADDITLFSGLFVLLLAPDFFQPLRNFSQFYHDRAAALAAANLIVRDNALCENDVSPVRNRVATTAVPLTSAGLEMIAVVAAHHDTTSRYRPVSLRLEMNQTLVITGPSGVGKTTLLLTLADFLPQQQGHIQRSWTKDEAVSFLPQTPWIINGTWAENLRLLSPTATDANLISVLQFLGFESLLADNPHLALQRRINEHGEGLSGGQLRRLALARILLAPQSVIFLDEPTASLDTTSRDYVLKALAHLQASATLIIVSHDDAVLTLAHQHLHLTPEAHYVE